MLLLQGYDIDTHLHLSRKNTNVSLNDTSQTLAQQSFSTKEVNFGGYNINPYEAVKTKNLLNRRQTCKEQVTHWTGVLRQTEAEMLVQAEPRPRTIAVEGTTQYRRTEVGEIDLNEVKEFRL